MSHLLSTPLGEPGSGRVRYGAAMALFREGRLSEAALEVYRIASADDAEDPRILLAERGLSLPSLPPPGPEALLRALIEEADSYLVTLPGPGVAEVRAGIAAHRAAEFQAPVAARDPVVAAHLPAALAALSASHPALAAAIAAAAPHLGWAPFSQYDRAQIGAVFADNQAYCTLMGEDGPVRTKDFDLGLFLVAPHVLYRDHCHPAPELYAPLTGPHGWRFRPDAPLVVKPAHQPVWNPPLQAHLTKVGPLPFLCLYGWTADVNLPPRVLQAGDWPALEALRLDGSAVT